MNVNYNLNMNLRKTFIAFLLLLFVVACSAQTGAQAQTKTQTPASSAPKEIVWSAMTKTYGGDLPVHVDSGHVYMEIPQAYIGRHVLISAQVDRGFGYVSHFIHSVGVARIELQDAQTLSFVALDKYDKSKTKTIKDAGKQEMDFAIVGRTNTGSALIDLTETLLVGDNWFDVKAQNEIRELYPELSSLLNVKVHGGTTQFSVRRYYGSQAEDKMLSSSMIVLPDASLPLDISCRVQLLPKELAPIRLVHKDLGNLSSQGDALPVVCRWVLKEPLVFYVDSLFPPQYFGAVKAGVEVWNKVLANVGIANALQVQRVSPDIGLAQQRAYISFSMNGGKSESMVLRHPVSGELLRCWICLASSVVAGKGLDYFLLQSQLDKRLYNHAYDEELVQEGIQGVVMSLLANVLGVKNAADYGPGALQPTAADVRALAYAYALAEGDTPKEEQTNLLACLSALPKACNSDVSPFMKRVHVMENVLELIRRIDRNPAVVGNKQLNNGTSLKNIYRFAVGMYGRQLEALAETFSAERSSQLQRESSGLLIKYLLMADEGLYSKVITQHRLTTMSEEMNSSINRVCDILLNDVAFTRLLKQGKRAGAYTANEHFDSIVNALFFHFDAEKCPSNYQANLQLRCIEALNKLVKGAPKRSAEQLWAQQRLSVLRKKLGVMAQKCSSPQWKTWYVLLQKRR